MVKIFNRNSQIFLEDGSIGQINFHMHGLHVFVIFMLLVRGEYSLRTHHQYKRTQFEYNESLINKKDRNRDIQYVFMMYL